MIIGDPSTFAIESGITKAYVRLGFRALGFFVLHIGGRRFGVYAPDATMLACSFGSVEDRIAHRGTHIAPFANEPGGVLADSFLDAIYAPEEEAKTLFGMTQSELSAFVYSKHLVWAPDGDEAFDDGSSVLQFDVGDRVRLIGFKCSDDYHHTPGTLSEYWLDADTYYAVLEQWRDAFLAEWSSAQKISEEEDQTPPNQALLPTPMSVTIPAAQEVAPATGAAHL
jgi:hypothetical protein